MRMAFWRDKSVRFDGDIKPMASALAKYFRAPDIDSRALDNLYVIDRTCTLVRPRVLAYENNLKIYFKSTCRL